jgi:hypothetical protein
VSLRSGFRALACATVVVVSSAGAPVQAAVSVAAEAPEPAPFTLFIQPAALPPTPAVAPVAAVAAPTPAASARSRSSAAVAGRRATPVITRWQKPANGTAANATAPPPASAVHRLGFAAQPQLAYWGGAVERDSSINYSIFWQPTGSSMSANYQTLINRYFQDIGGSQFYDLLRQYSDAGGPIVNNSSLGGTWTDTTAYPANTPTFPANTLSDTNIQESVIRAMDANNWWPAAGVNANFFVYTAAGEESCISPPSASNVCSNNVYCAYHFDFSASHLGASYDIKYADEPYDGNHLNGCGVPTSPNNDFDADSEINTTSHEHFEMVTDPGPTIGWLDQDPSNPAAMEIGDKCLGAYGTNAGPVDIALHGHPYILQQEWSNAAAGCAWSLLGDSFILTAQPSLAGTGAGSITLAPVGLDCSTACAVSLPANALVTLTAAADTGSAFTGWSGACAGTGACTLTMSAARDVTAAFDFASCAPRPPVAVSIRLNGAGQFQATVSSSGANNALRSIQFGSATNGLIDIGSQTGLSGNFSTALAPGAQQATFDVHRPTVGVATTVPLVVTDNCGTWSTFVGAGVNVP